MLSQFQAEMAWALLYLREVTVAAHQSGKSYEAILTKYSPYFLHW